jgi:hypothetical protein
MPISVQYSSFPQKTAYPTPVPPRTDSHGLQSHGVASALSDETPTPLPSTEDPSRVIIYPSINGSPTPVSSQDILPSEVLGEIFVLAQEYEFWYKFPEGLGPHILGSLARSALDGDRSHGTNHACGIRSGGKTSPMRQKAPRLLQRRYYVAAGRYLWQSVSALINPGQRRGVTFFLR